MKPTTAGLILIVLGILWLGFSVAKLEEKVDAEARFTSNRTACRVLVVYDGDTLGCDISRNGKIERPQEEIRLLGIDTPEMHYSRKNATHDSAHPIDEPGAKVASDWLQTQVYHQTVYLELDVQSHDKYGRMLAYVYAGPNTALSFNEKLLQLGYARLLILGKNRRYEEDFRSAEDQARSEHLGLWKLNSSPN